LTAMAQFMLVLYEKPGDFASMSPEEIQKIIEKYGAWNQKLAAAGTLVNGRKLTEDGGKRLNIPGGKISVVDGPYAEAKEVVGGIFIIRAKDYNEATEIAKTCPHIQFGQIDVRQIDFMGQPET
jgi:hypothetical protein